MAGRFLQAAAGGQPRDDLSAFTARAVAWTMRQARRQTGLTLGDTMFSKRALIAAAALAAFAPSAPAFSQPAAGPVAKVRQGEVRGIGEAGVTRFLGIPFAAPPVDALRWRPPTRAAAWTGTRDGSKAGNDCTKVEDCLYLNVTRPADAKPGAKLPVMVWIHGGAYVLGSSERGFGAEHDGAEFARKGVVTVTLNYRLGRAGWFAHPALTKEGPTGNYGMMDQIAALQWVRDNIAAFGGDPRNVTIFGESAGGISVLYLMLSPDAKGLFHKAISQSGFARHQPTPLKVAEAGGLKVAASAGIEGEGPQAAAALRWLPLSAIPVTGPITGPGRPGPILDGKLIAQPIAEGFAAGRQARIPLVIGGNSNEASLFRPQPAQLDAITEGRDALMAAYDPTGAGNKTQIINDLATAQYITEPDRNLARIHARAGQPTWLYYFSYVPADKRATALGARHTDEIRYVFGGPLQKFGPGDEAISRSVNAYWAAFARSGDPGAAGGVAWPRYAQPREPSIEFGADGVEVRDRHLAQRLDWVEQSLKK